MAWENIKTKLCVLIPCKDPSTTIEWSWFHRQLRVPQGTHFFFDRSHESIDVVRENMVEEALKENPEYILFWDKDIVPPPDAVLMLMSHQYPVCSGLYPDKGNRWSAFIYKDGDILPVKNAEDNVLFVDAVGLGFTLIETEVFRHLSKPWFKYEYNRLHNPKGLSEDMYFCMKVQKELGIKVLLNGWIKCRHHFFGDQVSPEKITHMVV